MSYVEKYNTLKETWKIWYSPNTYSLHPMKSAILTCFRQVIGGDMCTCIPKLFGWPQKKYSFEQLINTVQILMFIRSSSFLKITIHVYLLNSWNLASSSLFFYSTLHIPPFDNQDDPSQLTQFIYPYDPQQRTGYHLVYLI